MMNQPNRMNGCGPSMMPQMPGAHCANGSQMNQRELFDWIAMLGFCSFDMLLYMDTHPNDQEALDYFNQCTELYNAAKKSYEERFGQVNAFSSGPLSAWNWNAEPMPWEGGR